MADQIVFRGAHIRYYDGRLEEGGAFVRIHMTADLSEPVLEEMEWEDPGSSVTSAKLEGQLLATHLVLTPGDKQLRNEEIQFDISEVLDFNVASVKEGDSRGRELRFTVRSSAAGVAAIVEQYVRRVGDHKGALKVSYTKQEELPLGTKPSTGDDRRRDEQIDVKIMDGAGKTVFEGAAGDLKTAASTLASAREAAGGTHAKKKSQAAVQ